MNSNLTFVIGFFNIQKIEFNHFKVPVSYTASINQIKIGLIIIYIKNW